VVWISLTIKIANASSVAKKFARIGGIRLMGLGGNVNYVENQVKEFARIATLSQCMKDM